MKWGWLTVNPAANASPPRSKKQHLELPDPADVARLIGAAAKVNPSLPTYFRLAAATGARRGELCALRWKHIELEKRRVTIARRRWRRPKRPPKSSWDDPAAVLDDESDPSEDGLHS